VLEEFQLNSNNEPNSLDEKIQNAIHKYSIDGRNIVVLDRGRELGEHSAVLIKNGILKGVGYIDLNYQLNNIHILESIITPMEGNAYTTYLIESYLRKSNRVKIIELNE